MTSSSAFGLRRRSDSGISPKEIESMFPQIEEFIRLHREHILPPLEVVCSTGGNGVGAVFLKTAPYLKFYIPYVSTLDECRSTTQTNLNAACTMNSIIHFICVFAVQNCTTKADEIFPI